MRYVYSYRQFPLVWGRLWFGEVDHQVNNFPVTIYSMPFATLRNIEAVTCKAGMSMDLLITWSAGDLNWFSSRFLLPEGLLSNTNEQTTAVRMPKAITTKCAGENLGLVLLVEAGCFFMAQAFMI